MNISEKYQTINISENGYPEDAFLRRVVYLAWSHISQINHASQASNRRDWENTLAAMIDRHLPNEPDEAINYRARMEIAGRLVERLIAAGTLVADGSEGKFRFASDRLTPDTAEARTANFSGTLKKLAERTVKSTQAQEKLLNFLIDARNLYGFHLTDTSEGRAVMFPSRFVFDEHGFQLDGATALIITRRGLEVWDISGRDRFQIYFADGRPKFTVCLEGLAGNEAKTYDFSGAALLPHAGKSDFCRTINAVSKEMLDSVKCLAGKRDLVSAIIGEEIETAKWLGFVQSFYKVRSFFASIRGVVFSILETDVRKCAGRARKATYEDYNWFLNDSDEIKERRIQASDAFPLLTGEFRSEPFNTAISEGRPLLPLIAEKFGFSIPQARQLRGLHWQRLGKSIHQYERLFKSNNRMFMGVPPEKMPKSKKDWGRTAQLTKIYTGRTIPALSDKMIMILNRGLSDNPDNIPDFKSLDIDAVMSDIAKALAPFVTGEYSPYFIPGARDRAAFFGAIMNGNFGVKRVRSLSEDWHRLAPLRAGAIRLMLRKVHNIPLAEWEPLTENFACEHGTLTWLTNEAELISEGLRMRHCVGSYIDRCVLGRANIATVASTDGEHSTVEIRLNEENPNKGKQYVVQHRTYKNGSPSAKCDAVVAAYLKTYQKERLTAKGGTPSQPPPNVSISLGEEVRNSLVDAYKDCVPAHVFAMSAADWETAYHTYTRDEQTFTLYEDDFDPYE